MNISAKFQLHPLMASEEIFFWYFFANFQSNSLVWTKLTCLVEDFSRKVSVTFLSKYLQ